MKSLSLALSLLIGLSTAQAQAQQAAATPQAAKELFQNAFALAKQWNYRAAAWQFQRGLELAPQDADAWRLYGEALEKDKRKREALSAYKKALKLLPASRTKDIAVLEAKLNSVKLNIVPGPSCLSMVKASGLTPEEVGKMVAEAQNFPVVIDRDYVHKHNGAETVYMDRLCGDVYVIHSIGSGAPDSFHVIGYPTTVFSKGHKTKRNEIVNDGRRLFYAKHIASTSESPYEFECTVGAPVMGSTLPTSKPAHLVQCNQDYTDKASLRDASILFTEYDRILPASLASPGIGTWEIRIPR